MRKTFISLAAIAMMISLAGCSNQKRAGHEEKVKSSTVVKKRKSNKKTANVKKSEAKSSVATKDENAVSGSNVSSSKQSSADNQSKNVQQISNDQKQMQEANGNFDYTLGGKLPPANSLSDFVNKYGESPAAYLSDHKGYSAKQALDMLPDGMMTFGERQTKAALDRGEHIPGIG